MKKINVILAGFAVLSLAVSCNGFLGSIGVKAPGVDVKIDRQSEVAFVRVADLDGNSHVKTATDGELYIEKEAKEPVKATTSLTSGKNTISGKLTIDGSDLPSVAKPVDGELVNAGVIVTVENPAPDPVEFDGTLVIDDKSGDIPSDKFIVPEGDVKSFGLLKEEKTDLHTQLGYEDPIILPESFSDPISDGIDEIVIKDMSVTPKKGSKAPAAAETYEFTVKAKYYSSLSYKPGAKVHIDKTFDDLGILIDVDDIFKEYDIYFDIESTVPFDIKFSASSPDGLTGTSEDVVKAGEPGKPVKSSIVLHVVDNSGKKVNAISTATLSLDLTAGQNSKFAKGQTLKIDTSKLTIVKL